MERISEEDLKKIHELSEKRREAKIATQNAVLAARVADLEYENLILRMYSVYNLKLGKDTITNEGVINRVEEKVEQVQEVQEGEK